MCVWQFTAIGSGVAFFLKVYYHDTYLNKINGTNDNIFIGLFRRIFAIKYLFPIIKKSRESFGKLIYISNVCLYCLFVLTLILKITI